MLIGKMECQPVFYDYQTIDDEPYIILHFIKDSVFINNSSIVKDPNILNDVYKLFVAHGKLPSFIDYNSASFILDNGKEHCDMDLGINHVIYELIFAHIFRDADDPYTPHRLTDMKKAPIILSLHQKSHGPTSGIARISGGYLSEGITSNLVDETGRPATPIENLLIN